MHYLNEKHLIHRTQYGNSEAFNPLVEKYHLRLYTHILRRIKDTEIDAENPAGV